MLTNENRADIERILEENVVRRPPVPIYDIAVNMGCKIYRSDDLPEPYLAVISRPDRLILVSRNDTAQYQNWGIARALAFGHLHGMGRPPYTGDMPMYAVRRKPVAAKSGDLPEQLADEFAAALLVPDKFLREFSFAPETALAELFIAPEPLIRWRLEALSLSAA